MHVIEVTQDEFEQMLTGKVDEPSRAVVIFNGPRGSGKDFFCRALQKASPREVLHFKFSMVMKKVMSNCIGLPIEKLEDIKTEHMFGLDGSHSYVELQIEFWKFLAERFGEDILGHLAWVDMMDLQAKAKASELSHYITMFSDGGRGAEVEYIAERVGRDKMLVIQLERDGCSFEGDIRNYIDIEGVQTVRYHNEGTKQDLANVEKIIFDFVRPIFLKDLGFSDELADAALQILDDYDKRVIDGDEMLQRIQDLKAKRDENN